LAGSAVAIPAAPGSLRAQAGYPNRPVRLLSGFGAGSGADLITRILADRLSVALGKQVIVENVVGASGNLAGERVAKSEPDGHTLVLAGSSAIVINPSLYSMTYDPVHDLVPISQICAYPNVLAVTNTVAANNMRELVELARAQPGALTFGSSGVGTTIHLSGELLRSMAKIDIRHIPYRGGTNFIPDLIAGRITMFFATPQTALPLIREGKVKGFAVTSAKRLGIAPDLPTMAESGFPGFDITVWYGLMAAARTPQSIVDRLYQETVRILAMPETRKQYEDIGNEVIGSTPDEFSAAIKAEAPRWQQLIKDAGIKLD
jgi:tripartite-type tricarboxylate transporter receptor subunit TctC